MYDLSLYRTYKTDSETAKTSETERTSEISQT